MEGTQEEPGLRSICRTLAAFGVAAALCPCRTPAQGRPEFRIDGIVSKSTAVQAGGGVLFPLGTYVRSGLVVGAGITGGKPGFRADFVNAFHVDPFRESRWGPYGAGGFSFRHDEAGKGSNTFLLVLIGVEGPPRNGFSPAFELGLGGGVRAGVILRRAQGRNR
ncbi:MAG: hypothetical protein H0W69_04065 [Gemmatimonadaceae bacterium]|nr:hypothetical protein [Gemmatimonadaceae bacterium]